MYTYFMPTKLIVGENAIESDVDSLILGTKALIVSGRTSAVRSGALDDVTKALKSRGIEYEVFDRVENNPTIETTVEGGRAAREFGADFIIGIGGGSPLDAAKAVAVYAANEPSESFDIYDIFDGKIPNKPLPMAAVPTTAGTGSETTPYSILTLHKIKNKKSFSSPDIFYRSAFLDGRYTENLPLQTARNTAVDAMCHLLEGFTDKRSSPASDYIALEGLRLIGSNLDALINGGADTAACTELLFAATLGGIVIAQTGTTIVHSMGYPLTYYKDIPHGMANGLLLGEYLTLTDRVLPWKTDLYLEAMGIDTLGELKEIISELVPCDVKFSEKELGEWTKTTIQAKNVSVCPFDVTREMEIEMYKKCLL